MSPPEMEVNDKDDQTNDTPETPNPGTAMQTLGPLTCTTLSPQDAMTLRCQLGHDPHRLNVLGNILKSMTDLMMPNHDMVWNLLVVTEGGYNCPFPQCSRHRDGWSRADRTRAHIYADHLLIRYKCDKWCVRCRIVFMACSRRLVTPTLNVSKISISTWPATTSSQHSNAPYGTLLSNCVRDGL